GISDKTLRILREINLLHALPRMEARRQGSSRPRSAEEVLFLDLHGTYLNESVTDAGMKELAPLKNLRELHLPWSVTDKGMKELTGFKDLTELNLFGCHGVTDAGLKTLTGLKNLKRIVVYNCKVTDAGIAEFKKALPNCEVAR